ncbi:MAG: tetratricopeptide repeat protein [Chloroflexi bacterium]|nr:tetratricopeptide repeat protein [Chloroflexota bacterium]
MNAQASALPARAPEPGSNVPVLDAAAWAAAVPYLPQVLLDSVRRNPHLPPSWIEAVDGTLLFSDIAGFTQLSERLTQMGKEGAEALTDVINRYFDGLLGIARRHGGANIKFGGDALLLLFTGDDHAHRAVLAAFAMQRVTRQFGTVRAQSYRVRLQMKVALHSGTFWSATAGLPGRRMQHFILGTGTARIAQVEDVAHAGEVLASEATQALVSPWAAMEPYNGAYRILRLAGRGPARAALVEKEEDSSLMPDLLAYIPPPVAQQLRGAGQAAEMEGEHRKVSTMFIHLLGVNELLERDGPAVLLDELQRYVAALVRLGEQYGGFVAANDISGHGVKLIVLFGAPVAHEEDSTNALRLALHLRRELPQLDVHLSQRIGVNTGFVFAGNVGPAYRREYTVMGDAVNVAARLMGAAASEQILVSGQTMDEAGSGFVVQHLEPITVKGKKAPLSVVALEGERDITASRDEERPVMLVGREAELETLFRVCTEVEGGNEKCAVISGETGMGKSLLLLAFTDLLKRRGWVVHLGHSYSHTAGVPFGPWLEILHAVFQLAPADDEGTRTAKVVAVIERLRPELLNTAPLLNALLSLAIPDTDLTRSFNEETRRRRLFDLIADVLKPAATESPVAVFLDDVHWADQSSLQLLSHVSNRMGNGRLLVGATHRPQEGLQLALPPASTVTIALGELPEKAAVQIVEESLNLSLLPSQVKEAILAKARGNPLFLEQVARSLQQSGALTPKGKGLVLGRAEQMALLNIPDRLQGLVMSRIDALKHASREALRIASVIGSAFDLSVLKSAASLELGGPQLETAVQDLTQLGLFQAQEGVPEPAYRFREALFQEVAYESLSFARRRALHHRVASYLEEAYGSRLKSTYEALALHYGRSGDFPKTLLYATSAGDKAREVFAHEEAIAYYQQGISSLKSLGSSIVPLGSHLLERIGDCYEVSGHHTEAARHFYRALRVWRGAQRHPILSPPVAQELLKGLPTTAREAALCTKIGVSHEHGSDYGASLRWLESAIRALPPRQPLPAARAYVAKGVSLFRQGRYQEAIAWGQRGLAVSRRLGDRRQLAYAHDMVATSYVELGNLARAVRHRHAAIRMYDELGDVSGQASANNNLGTCYHLLGLLDQALSCYDASLKACQRLGNPLRAAVAHNNMGEVYLIQGHVPEAQEHLTQVVETFQRVGEPLAATGFALINLSKASQRRHQPKEAWDNLRRGVTLLRKAGARGLLTEAFLQQAELEMEDGLVELATRTCGRALGSAREMGMQLQEARGLCIEGRIAMARHDPAQAEERLRQSIALAEGTGAQYERGVALLNLAKIYLNDGQGGASRKSGSLPLRRATSIFRRLGAEIELAQAQELWASQGVDRLVGSTSRQRR